MHIVETDGPGIAAVLTRDETLPLAGRIEELRSWAQSQGVSTSVDRDGEGARIAFPDRPAALSFLGAFVPGALADIARPIADAVADFAEVSERDGEVAVLIRYVGDAGSGTDREPHDRTSEDFRTFAEGAREAGFDVEQTHADHDTIEAVLRPAPAAA